MMPTFVFLVSGSAAQIPTSRRSRLISRPDSPLSPVSDEELIMVPHTLSLPSGYPRSPGHQLGGKPGKCAGFRGGNRFCCILGKQQAFVHQP